MIATVAICTWNRSDLLARTLGQLAHLVVPHDLRWELIVVNNACTDDTSEVIARFGSALPVREVHEEKPGHSNARNRAVDEARGALVVWTDDDVLVDPHWLAEHVAGAARHPDAAFFGGPVHPWFESTPPPWIERNFDALASAFACVDLGAEERVLGGETPYGANMVVRRRAYRHIRYDPNLGRKRTGMVGGDEIAVFRALAADGEHGVWLPGARVRHFIPRARATGRYVARYHRGLGRTLVREDRDAPLGHEATLLGVPRWALRRAVGLYVGYLRHAARRQERQALRRWLDFQQLLGTMAERRARTCAAQGTGTE